MSNINNFDTNINVQININKNPVAYVQDYFPLGLGTVTFVVTVVRIVTSNLLK